MILKRKIYKKLLEWKNECQGKKALLIEGARRIGKSTICEEFGKNEYESYIIHPRNLIVKMELYAFPHI